MHCNPYAMALLGLTVSVGVGCASRPQTSGLDREQIGYLSPSLVMPGLALQDDAADASVRSAGRRYWEYARNDARLGAGDTPPYGRMSWVEIRTRESLQIVNGRPREFSTILIRTGRHRLVR